MLAASKEISIAVYTCIQYEQPMVSYSVEIVKSRFLDREIAAISSSRIQFFISKILKENIFKALPLEAW